MNIGRKVRGLLVSLFAVVLVSSAIAETGNLGGNDLAFKTKEAVGENKPIVQIPFEVEFDTIVIPISINGSQTLRCVLDTGMPGGVFLVNPKTAKDIDLKYVATGMKVQGSGSDSETANMALGAKVGLAGLELENQRIIVLDKEGFLAKIGIDGAIGASIFNNFVVQMDFEKRVASLFSKDGFDSENAGEKLALQIVNTKAFLKAKVNVNGKRDIPVSLLLDTGAGAGLSIEKTSLAELEVPEKGIRGVLGAGVGGNIEGVFGRVSSLYLGKHRLGRVTAGFPDQGGSSANGTIGMGILRRFLVTIDYPNKRIFLTPNRTFKEPFEYSMTGFSVRPNVSGELIVLQVFPDSGAFKAGIRTGDTIISIDKKTLDFSSYSRMLDRFKEPGKRILVEFERSGERFTKLLKLRRLF